MRLASAADFEQGGLYWPPYQDHPMFAQRANELNGRYAQNKVLIAGCGYGYTVNYCLNLGMDIWGCDASQYALDKATEVLPPAARARITMGDITSRNSLNSVRSFAGLSGKQLFQGVVTEDVLGVLTPAEVSTALVELRRIGNTVLHIVTCSKPTDMPGDRHPDLIWRSQQEWKSIATPDLVMDVETGIIL